MKEKGDFEEKKNLHPFLTFFFVYTRSSHGIFFLNEFCIYAPLQPLIFTYPPLIWMIFAAKK